MKHIFVNKNLLKKSPLKWGTSRDLQTNY